MHRDHGHGGGANSQGQKTHQNHRSTEEGK